MAAAGILSAGPSGASAPGGATSALWGESGEKWDPAGRLTDFSFAGYRMGEAPLPVVPVRGDVRAFGARGDGRTDDTRAFQEAIAKTSNGALFVPPGRYVITDVLEIEKPGLVLRGAGPDKTVLFFPRPLNDVRPNWGATTTGKKTSNYSWGGGYIVIKGGSGGSGLGRLAKRAKRGEYLVTLEKAPRLRPGGFVEIIQKDDAGNSLARYLYAGQADDVSKLQGSTRTSFVSRVLAVEGAEVRLERALRTDVDPAWGAEMFEFAPRVTESGVEDLTFEFPCVDYGGEFSELGYNPVAISGAAHCWLRDIRAVNCDSGPYLSGRFCTARGVVLESRRRPDRTGVVGHHGITCYGDDNLVEQFDIRAKFVHDLTVEHSAGNVFRNGKAVDLSFDHHKRAPHANLFTDIDIGEGRRMYRCGGGEALGRNSAAWGTFWNIRAQTPQHPPPARFGPDLMNYVGVESRDEAVTEPDGKWWEPISPALLRPQDLYQAMLARRLGGTSRPAGADPRKRP